ncbi:APC family permease [Streptosporangium roseum]|uniref:Amino acid transporter-like protein n=1 Tax=Streptosporangium roseum (strain ATCC 12428 / DSM 43021 / JCM 3005 / KCTC 9067 / NCIMB 10171 / NRRL 2505 / NI 9100) TaxID=479432 RepID=D2B8M1_STRRD|nr:APC family permease [Streptosporangium roseum]ACZ87831.1 Amino acid transporter-like protein [Streptosporangium roseum DSM 43021]
MSEPPTRIEKPPQHFHRVMTWRDAFSLAITLPASAFALVGYWTGALGAWAAVTLLAVSGLLAICQNFVYAEMAAMFPDKPGGIALYASAAWGGRSRPLGALASAGYWIGWSFGLAGNALVVGELIEAQWFPRAGTLEVGPLHLGGAHAVAVAALVLVWLLNTAGIRPAVRLSTIVNTLVLVVLAVAAATALLTGNLHLDRLTWGLGGDGQSPFVVACVWLFLMGWTVYGTEIAATFTPEYRNPRSDAPRALISSGIAALAVFVLMPVLAAGTTGEAAITAEPLGFTVVMFENLFGGAGWLAVVVLCLAMLNLMSVATADSGRALHGMAVEGLTVRSLGVLNSAGMPARAMTAGLLVNVGLVVFIGNLLGVVFASNIGYMIAVVVALCGYVLLRRANTTPDRAFRLHRCWVSIAAALAGINLLLLVVAAFNPELTGYGSWRDELIGFGVLALAMTLYAARRLGDRTPTYKNPR